MRIDAYLYLNQLLKDDSIKFIEGNIIQGKIKETDGQTASIAIKGFGVIKAAVEGDVKGLDGKDVDFVVKSVEADKIELKIVSDNSLKDSSTFKIKGKEYLSAILREFNIKNDDISIKLLENFIKYNIKVDRDNLNNGINILDKLNQIINLEDGEIIVPVDSNKFDEPIENQDLKNLLIIKDDTNMSRDKGLDIKNSFIKEINEINLDIIKTVAFFIKHKIKPTLNNIKFFIQLNENPELFSKDYEILKNYFSDEFTNFHKNIIIKNKMLDDFPEEIKEEYIQRLNDKISSFESRILNGDEKVNKALKEYSDKVELLKEMNKDLVFIYLPFSVKEDYKEGIITLFKNRNRKNRHNKKVNIYISLNTNNFGRLKIVCQVSGFKIDVKFGNIRNAHLDFFKSKEEELKELVKTTGYEVSSITYSINDSVKILDTLIENPNPTYYLNVKV